ncbi:unnamed protein product [Ascophyllum nodosum]
MASEMSDSDEDGGDIGSRPQVTAFDKPQSVTFGGAASPAKQALRLNDDSSTRRSGSGNSSKSNSSEGATVALPTDRSNATEHESKAAGDHRDAGTVSTNAASQIPRAIDDGRLTENGMAVREGDQTAGGRLSYVWRQTSSEVIVVVPAPSEARAADVLVSLSPKEETIAEGVVDFLKVAVTTGWRRDISNATDTGGASTRLVQKGHSREEEDEQKEVLVLLEGELSFQAKLDGEGDADWELKDFPGTVVANSNSFRGDGGSPSGATDHAQEPPVPDCRGIEVTLVKHSPLPGVTLWWKSLMKGGPEIDVSAIQGRPANKHRTAWEEALAMFKEKVAKRKIEGKIPIDTGENG